MLVLAPGTPVHVDHRKWDGTEHWQGDPIYLGLDDFGHWAGSLPGARVWKHDAEFFIPVPQIKLFPTAPWTATFYERPDPSQVQVYVDVATEPIWHESEDPVRVGLIDLDLDVIRRGETVFIDDEDEFAEHKELYGYPADVVERSEKTAAKVLDAVNTRSGPFAPEVAAHWFGVLHGLERG